MAAQSGLRSNLPVFPDVGYKRGSIRSHRLNHLGGRIGFFVRCRPQNHFHQHGGEVYASGGQAVDEFACIVGIAAFFNDVCCFQPLQPIREDVGGDFFAGIQEFVIGTPSVKHHVAHDEQRPSVTQDFQQDVNRASRTKGHGSFLFHANRVRKTLALGKLMIILLASNK